MVSPTAKSIRFRFHRASGELGDTEGHEGDTFWDQMIYWLIFFCGFKDFDVLHLQFFKNAGLKNHQEPFARQKLPAHPNIQQLRGYLCVSRLTYEPGIDETLRIMG